MFISKAELADVGMPLYNISIPHTCLLWYHICVGLHGSARKWWYNHTDATHKIQCACFMRNAVYHDDVIKWKHFPRYWPFVRGIHRSPVNSPHKGQWHGTLMFSLICTWMNGSVNNREVGDLRRHLAHFDVTLMKTWSSVSMYFFNLPDICTEMNTGAPACKWMSRFGLYWQDHSLQSVKRTEVYVL